MDRIVDVHPSKSNSPTYGFLQTRTINPGRISERTISNAVAQYPLIALTKRLVKNDRIINVVKSPNDDANGVAILSMT